MAITRRQFVTRLGALAAAAGFSQVEASKIMDAMAYNNVAGNMGSVYGGTFGKPRVVWLHGAECTGCSTSLLGIFENSTGAAVYNQNGTTAVTTAAALGLSQALPTTGESDPSILPGPNASGNLLLHAVNLSPDPTGSIDIADVVIDVIDLIYHETVMGMGADTAYQWLKDFEAQNTLPFVLVVEGALQLTGDGSTTGGGAWSDYSSSVAWCSIASDGTANLAGTTTVNAAGDIVTGEMVAALGSLKACVAIIAIGQCATFGGYPGCRPPISSAVAGFDTSKSQSGALGTFDYLDQNGYAYASAKVVNVPGCPTNPWWFVLSVVAATVDLKSILVDGAPVGTLGILEAITPVTDGVDPRQGNLGIGINAGNAASAGVDTTRRIKAVYGTSVHGPYCPRYRYFVTGTFAAQPGDTGCLQKIGCKGPAASSLCGIHGWNGQQPTNPVGWDDGVSNANLSPGGVPTGGHCTRAGHPCMACTEKGYPDNFVPFLVR
ncbi:MAG: twin-arginine translocation signal domain-containing protein [Coriobacteriia bacterium]|nr:twin-arginine translocation signal domain-containing protein [Coriobacteriia bacterium]